MLLDDLVGVIETLKERIEDYKEYLQGEARTRAVLIDPLLRALGWDVSDPAIVALELPVQCDGKNINADYALLKPKGDPVAIVEARKLGTRLDEQIKQTSDYAKARYAVLTNGDTWQVYDQKAEEKPILNVSIAETPAHELALDLLLLWRRNLSSGQPKQPMDSRPSASLVPTPDSTPRFPLDECPTTGEKPNDIEFPDRLVRKANSWVALLQVVVGWLYTEEKLTEKKQIEEFKGSIRWLEPHARKPAKFTPVPIKAKDRLVVKYLSAEDTKECAVKLLKHFNIPPAEVRVSIKD